MKFPLGNERLARTDGPETSKEAADYLRKGGLSLLQKYVFLTIKTNPDLSMKQAYNISVAKGQLVGYGGFTTRYSELARADLIEKSGKTINRGGRSADTWRVTEDSWLVKDFQ